MEILAKRELLMRKKEIINKIKSGSIFICPTDTIYGISCIATNKDSIDKIRTIKNRPESPFSIWVPSLNWVKENCNLTEEQFQEINSKLPGPYTFIVKIKNKNCISPNVNPNNNSVGIRLPNHKISKLFSELDVPIVTTSANKQGEPFMTSVENLDSEVEREVEFMIYEGEKQARPSKIINFITEEIVER